METPFEAMSESDTTNTSSRKEKWTLGLFCLTTILLFADQNLMAPNLTAIANDFGFDAQERDEKLGGHIALAFFVLGAPASFVLGCLADTWHRPRLFAITVWIGEGACLATYFVRTYQELYVCRAMTGVSVGGALPLIYSMLGDLYAAADRHSVSATVSIGMGLGIGLGQAIAGWLGPTFGWRMPFVVVSIPALITSLVVYFTVEDPERGRMEESVLKAHDSESIETARLQPSEIEMSESDDALTRRRSSSTLSNARNESNDTPTGLTLGALDQQTTWQKLQNLCLTPSVVLLLLQGVPGCLPWGIVNTFLNDYLSEDRGMSVEVWATCCSSFRQITIDLSHSR